MGDIFNEYEGKWVFVKSGSDKYIGRCVVGTEVSESVRLQPAFYYISEYMQDPQNGNVTRQLMITPIELCIGFDSEVTINDICLIIEFDKMSSEDKHQFEKAVRQGVDGMIEAKAAKSGITLESNMPSDQSILFG